MRRFVIALLLTAFAGAALAAETPPPPPADGHQCEHTKDEPQTS